MKLATIGIGNGGSKVVDAFLEMSHETRRDVISDAYAINTAESDLRVLDTVPDSNQILLTSPEMRASGTGNKPELGAELMETNLGVVKNSIGTIPWHATDALLVLAALGGGTGSGGAPILANNLREWYDLPVFGLGLLPNEHGHMEFNAARSFMDFGKATDNLLVVDNAQYLSAEGSIQDHYVRINRDIARKWVTFLSAGERSTDSAEMYIDSADLFAVLQMGGISVLGYASQDVEQANRGGLLDRFRTDGQQIDENVVARKVVDVVKNATKNLTMDVDVQTAEGVAFVVTGPSDELSQRGITEARQYLADLTDAQRIVHGDDPRESATEVSAAVLFSNVGNASRIDELKQRGQQAKQEIEERREQRTRKQQEMFSEGEYELGSIQTNDLDTSSNEN